MKNIAWILLILVLTSACAGAAFQTDTPLQPTPQPVSTNTAESSTTPSTVSTEEIVVSTLPVPDEFFIQMGISLPAPVCSGLTQPQTEGPYYTPNTPERNSLLEEGMPGTRLVLVGYVLDQNCHPLTNAWLDFWQADSNGDYDNAGYRLRGHQFTDSQGRYYLETILPGLYSSRPIEHIHVKVKPEGGAEVTSQLYFPDQPVEGLTVMLEERGDHFVGYFNFVVQK
jgi:protocatechuate 3,4-dioxygenase beta subunit